MREAIDSADGLQSGQKLQLLRSRPMTMYQVAIVTMAVLVDALDGFDILASSFASPGITAEWGISRDTLGMIISAGLLGVALGSALLSFLADMVGRRPCLLLSLTLTTGATALSAMATTPYELAAWRLLTGLGIGGILPCIFAMAAEYSNDRRKEMSVGFVVVGFAVGGIVGGLISSWLLSFLGWRSVFYFGAAFSLLLLLPLTVWMPESLEYLVNKPRPSSLRRVNRILERLRLAPLASLPQPARRGPRIPVWSLLRTDLAFAIVALAMAFAAQFAMTYYFLAWIPQMVADLGFSASRAATVAVAANIGGLAGGLVISGVAHRLGTLRVVVVAYGLEAVTIALFGSSPPDLALLRVAAGLGGLFIYAVTGGLYILVTMTFPVLVRSTGTGVVIGLGRIGGIAAPTVAGTLFAAGWSRLHVSLVFVSLILTAAVVLSIWGWMGRRSPSWADLVSPVAKQRS